MICLNKNVFAALTVAKRKMQLWREDYNEKATQQPAQHGTKRFFLVKTTEFAHSRVAPTKG